MVKFKPMLVADADDKDIRFPKIGSIKRDGIRAIRHPVFVRFREDRDK